MLLLRKQTREVANDKGADIYRMLCCWRQRWRERRIGKSNNGELCMKYSSECVNFEPISPMVIRFIKYIIAYSWIYAMTFCATTSAANADSITQPGETVGLALGSPLPEGVYFVNTYSMGGYRGVDANTSTLGVEIPVLAWSTPWKFLGGRIEAYMAVPAISVGIPEALAPGASWAGRDYTALYNPALLVGEAWDLGGGWGFSNFVGGYAPVDNDLRLFGHNIWVFNERAALSYTGDKWNLTAHVVYGVTGDSEGGALAGDGKIKPDYLNCDLTAVKTFGKWQAGAVAFGSSDVSSTSSLAYKKQSQFTVGSLVGYDFPGITAQIYLTRDVYSENYFNTNGSRSYETRLWTRVIAPLWNPPAHEPLK
jgi:hypothetical protein